MATTNAPNITEIVYVYVYVNKTVTEEKSPREILQTEPIAWILLLIIAFLLCCMCCTCHVLLYFFCKNQTLTKQAASLNNDKDNEDFTTLHLDSPRWKEQSSYRSDHSGKFEKSRTNDTDRTLNIIFPDHDYKKKNKHRSKSDQTAYERDDSLNGIPRTKSTPARQQFERQAMSPSENSTLNPYPNYELQMRSKSNPERKLNLNQVSESLELSQNDQLGMRSKSNPERNSKNRKQFGGAKFELQMGLSKSATPPNEWKKRKNANNSVRLKSRPNAMVALPSSSESVTSGYTPGMASPHDPSFGSTPYGPPDDVWMVSNSHSAAAATPQLDDLLQKRDSGFPVLGKTILSPAFQASKPTPGERVSDPSFSLDEDLSKGLYDSDFVEPPENLNIGMYDKLIAEAQAKKERKMARVKSLDVDSLPALPSSCPSDTHPLSAESSLRSSMDMDDQSLRAAMSRIQQRQVSGFGNIPDLPPTPSATNDFGEQPTFPISKKSSFSFSSRPQNSLQMTENMISL